MKRVSWPRIFDSEEINNKTSTKPKNVIVKDENEMNEPLSSQDFGIAALFSELEDLDNTKEDINNNFWGNASESSFYCPVKVKTQGNITISIFKINENDQISIVPLDNSRLSSSISAVTYNSEEPCGELNTSNELMLQDLDVRGESLRLTQHLNELVSYDSFENITDPPCTEVAKCCSNEILEEDSQSRHLIETSSHNFIDSNIKSIVENTHISSAVDILKNNTDNKFIPTINQPKDYLFSVVYLILKQKEFYVDWLHAKNNYVELLSKVRNNQINVSSCNSELYLCASFHLHKYIYIDKPVNLFPYNNFNSIEPQLFKCYMMSIEHNPKANSKPDENKNANKSLNICSSNCTDTEVQESARKTLTYSENGSQAEEESSSKDKSNLEIEINPRQPLTQAISSQTYSSQEESQVDNFNSDKYIHEITLNDIYDIMEKCNGQPIILPDTMNHAPVTVFTGNVENTCQALDGTQQPIRKEALIFIYQDIHNNEEQSQERDAENQRGCKVVLSNNNMVPCVQYEDIKSMFPNKNAQDLVRKNEYYMSEFPKEEISVSSNLGKNSNCRKEPHVVSEEDSDTWGWKAVFTSQDNNEKLDSEDASTSPKEHVNVKTKPKSMQCFINELLLEDSIPEICQITDLSTKNCPKIDSRRLTILEKIFPNSSLQYSTLILKEVYANLLDLKDILIQSETSVKGAIVQYLNDKNLESQLLEILGKYSQNQINGEQKLHGIAHHLIEEQLQIIKNFKESSQAHIEMLINQKNMLEQENILLLKKLEMLHMKLKQSPPAETQTPDSNYILLENNEQLRNKLNFAQRCVLEQHIIHQEILEQLEQCADEVQNQKLEAEKQKCKRSSIYSDTVFLNFTHYKEFNGNLSVVIQIRKQNDFDIEKTHLSNELETYKKSVQDATEIANATLEGMKNLQTSFGESRQRVFMNNEKLKAEGTFVVNVLSICRSFIYELGLEVLNVYQESTTKEKEICSLKERNEQMQNVFSELETEYNTLRQQSEHVMSEKINIEKQLIKSTQENSDLKEHLTKNMQNQTLLEMEINELQKLKTAAKEQEVLKSQLERCVEELKTDKAHMEQKLLSDEKVGKSMEADLIKMTTILDMYETQNKELIKAKEDLEEQLENIKKSYFSLQNLPQQYEQLEKNYFKEIAEKDFITQQLKSLQEQLTEYSEAKAEHSKQMQNLESEFKRISKENLEMKWELKNLQNINQCLEHDNCDMLHRLEEESARHKCLVTESQSKTEELQNMVETQEKEIEELKSMLIEQTETNYSLQQECEGKKDVINNLEEKYLDLNNLHQKDENEICIMKNKIQELENQITSIKSSNKVTLNSIKYEFEALETTLKITQDDLNNSFIKLQEKETSLISFQEGLQTAEHRLLEKEHQIADNLRTIEILQNDLQDSNEIKNKYVEMQELLKDHGMIIQERDKLKEDLTNLQLEIEILQKDFKELQNKNNTLIKYCTLQKEHIKGMKVQINKLQDYLTKADIRNRENIEMDLHQVTYELAIHNNKTADLEFEIEEYKFILDEKQNGNEEKCRLQSQVMLLHELYKRNSNDLKQARKTIKIQEDKITELITQLNEESTKQKTTEKELETMTEKHQSFLAQMDTLKQQVQQETQNCFCLTEEYYKYQKEMSEKETKFLSNIQELKSKIEIMEEEIKEVNNEKEDLKQALESKQKEETLLKKRTEELEARLSDYGRTLSHLAQEKRKSEQLENQLQLLADEGRNLIHLQQLLQKQNTDITTALEDSKNELKRTEEALRAAEQLEKQHAAELQNMKDEHSRENSHHLEEVKLMEKNKCQSEQAVKKLMETEECLLRHKKDLSLKLLKSLRIIHQTKLKYKLANEKIQHLSTQTKSLREQKTLKEAEVVSLSSEIAELNEQVQQRNSESKLPVQRLQEHISKLEQQVEDLQLQLLKAKQKIHNENFKTEALLLIKEDIIYQGKEQINLLQEKTNRLCTRLAEAQGKILQLNQEQSRLKRDIMTLQAEKREITLQLHVIEGYLNEEKQQKINLEETYQKLSEKFSSNLKP